MSAPPTMRDFSAQLEQHPSLGSMVAHHRRVAGRAAHYGLLDDPLPQVLDNALAERGIPRLYEHQAQALNHARAGRDVLLVTPTASGKTLVFASAVLDAYLKDRNARALFLYPTKALAQDQIGGLRDLAGGLGALNPPRFEIYDGDTPATRRKKIRADPPQALITNPDMLHLGILGHHHDWKQLLQNLRWVVLDELHVYRGLFGAHVHHVLARLQRLCAHYGSNPQFIATSATIGNPAEFGQTLLGRPVHVVDRSGAPRSSREVMFLNPSGVSPYTVATRVVAEAIRGGHRTIAFTKARRITELLHTWLVQQEPALASRIAPYRAGYLPQERRRIEAQLFGGELLAVLSTSALELGIDVGGLDLCVLVGYPGSLISSWQRIGRVGRRGQDGMVVMIAMPDALDQYVVHHPELFFGEDYERAVLDPWNPFVASGHLVCAAAEEPLGRADLERWGQASDTITATLVQDGRLVQSAAGDTWFSFKRKPQREVSVRSAGQPYAIVERSSGKLLGSVDGTRVYYECHPGAIYLHAGRCYQVLKLDADQRRVTAQPVKVDYYTAVLGDKETEILERTETRRVGEFHVGLGRLKVTVRIREYQKKRLYDGEPFATHPLEVPPLVFETIGCWIQLPQALPAAFAQRDLHFMGGIHAAEHALIGLFPLLAIADRGDLGGISYTGHPQLDGPAVFIYDGMPGGAGLAEQGYRGLEHLLARTLERVSECACEDGCPACIQSPKCGNGNKPLDKQAAILTLQLLTGSAALSELGVEAQAGDVCQPLKPYVPRRPDGAPKRQGIRRAGNHEPAPADDTPAPQVDPAADPSGGRAAEQVAASVVAPIVVEPQLPRRKASQRPPGSDTATEGLSPAQRSVVFDLETQRSADEVGGWLHADKLGLALAVVYDVQRQVYRTYYEADVERLLLDLVMADAVIGFNIDRFDLHVLSGYTDWNLNRIRTVDLHHQLHAHLGFRISLQHLSEMNLGEGKAGSGMQSLQWWREGRIDLIEQYCRKDVEMTGRLYDLGRERGYLLYRDHADRSVRVPVSW